MKIAVYYNLPFSGAKRTVFEHIKGLRSLRHDVDVYTIDNSRDMFDPGNVASNEYRYIYKQRIIRLPLLRQITKDLSDFYLLKLLHKKIAYDIDKRNYDIALIHTDAFTQAPFILRFLRTRNIYFCLEPLKIAYEYGLRIPDNFSFLNKTYDHFNRHIRKVIDRRNAIASDASLAISYFGRELMIQAFGLYPKISYLGVDTKVFKKVKVPKKNQILFVGQKLDMNGYNYAQAAHKLIPENIRPELLILSISGEKKDRLSDMEIVKVYNESLITFSLSNFDTFGLVPLESFACEVPVIAFNVAGYKETVLDDQTGYLVDFDAKEIAKKATYLLKNRERISEMGITGRKWVEGKWTWEKQIKILESYLKESIES